MASSSQYELAIKIAGKVDSSFKNATKEAQGSLSSFSSAAKTAFKGIAIAGAAVTAAAVAAGKALYDLGTEFDAAYDTIRTGTGATGEALEDLKDSMKSVYSTIPAEMGDVATAISDYNTRLGLTGDALEGLSTQALQVSSMLGEDLSGVIESSSQAFKQWNIDADSMGGEMDYIFKVCQSTGMGFSTLMQHMQSSGAVLQDLGYSFDEAASMIANLDKAGINTEQVLKGMKKGLGNIAKDGGDAVAAMQDYCNQINAATSETEAITIATEIFGSATAVTMAQAIRSGAMDVETLTAALQENGETINGAAQDTYSFAQKWDIFKNKMQVALEPMAMTLFDSLSDAMDELMPVAEAIFPVITGAIEGMLPAIQELVPLVVDFAGQLATDLLPLLSQIISSILPPIISLVRSLLPVIMQLISTILPPIISLIEQLLPPLMQIVEAILPVVQALIMALAPVLQALMTALTPILNVVIQLITPLAGIIEKLSPIITLIGTLVSTVLTALAPAIEFISDLIGTVLNVAFESIGPIIDGVTAIFGGLIDFISNIFAGNWSAAWDSIVGVFGSIFGTIVEIAKAPINAVIAAINWVIEKVNSISVTIPSWVPVIGGTTLGFNIPTIPALATGGIATDATLAMVGEGTEPEAILPLSRLAEMLDGFGRGRGGDDNDYNDYDQSETITFAPVFNFYGAATKEEAEEAGRISFAEFKRLYQQMKAEERRKSFAPA